MEKQQVAVAVPTYNERENIVPLLAAIHEHLSGARVLVIDDSSPDGTAELTREFGREHVFVQVKSRSVREGLGAAYADGFGALLDAGYDIICQMDADFSHSPAVLPQLVEAVTCGGADLAIGSRYTAGGGTRDWGIGRRVMSRAGSLYAASVLGLPVADVTGGFKCWRADLLRLALAGDLLLRGFGFQVEMTYRARLLGARMVEIPIEFPDRQRGASKMNAAIFREAFLGVLRLRLRGRRLLRATRRGKLS